MQQLVLICNYWFQFFYFRQSPKGNNCSPDEAEETEECKAEYICPLCIVDDMEYNTTQTINETLCRIWYKF